MVLWHSWLAAIGHVLALFAYETHLGMGLSIILLTLAVRSALLPVTWAGAYRAEARRRQLRRLEPALTALKRRYEADRERLAQEMTRLYRREGVTLVDGVSLAGALIQLPVFLGIYQVLRALRSAGRFLWVANLSRPDFWLAMIAGAATMALMAMNPELPQNVRLLLILLPAIFTVIAALKFSAALSLYWTTTNVFSGAQTLALRAVMARRARAGMASGK
ncbi:MAG TPA: membrane protein insertase YidC [Steroidobacteraceae bacterium]|nr:membrane protein insertase YidC [Steroidobacteraceae bacterium]